MSELVLSNLVRSATMNEVGWFAQLITINFAMVVAICCFLDEAKIALKLFGFAACMIGSALFLGEIVIGSNVRAAALAGPGALPHPSFPTRQLIGVTGSWLGTSTAIVFNTAFWVSWIGIFYLLFFWRKSSHVARP